MENNPDTGSLEEQMEPGNPIAEEPATQPVKTGSSWGDKVTLDQGTSPGDREDPARSISEETQAPNSQTANQEPEPYRGKGIKEPERRVTRARGKGPNKLMPRAWLPAN